MKSKWSTQLTAAFLACAVLAAPLTTLGAESAKDEAKKEKQPKPYPLMVCIVSDEKLGEMGEPHVFVHEGREVKLCCKPCLDEFNGDTAAFVARIDKAAAKVKPYPMEVCLVSDENLGEMGEPHVFIHHEREIKLCCKGCAKEFNKETAAFVKKWDEAAIAKRKP